MLLTMKLPDFLSSASMAVLMSNAPKKHVQSLFTLYDLLLPLDWFQTLILTTAETPTQQPASTRPRFNLPPVILWVTLA
jgi:hypothetical protein